MNAALTTYAIRVDGHLDDHWAAWLGELDMTRGDGTTTTTTTVVVVSVADQAQRHGVLAGLRDVGAVLTEVRRAGASAPTRRSVLDHPLHTDRLSLRSATADDAEPTWMFRQVESVNELLSGCLPQLAGYRELFSEPARLATTVIVTLGHAPRSPTRCDVLPQPSPTIRSGAILATDGVISNPTRVWQRRTIGGHCDGGVVRAPRRSWANWAPIAASSTLPGSTTDATRVPCTTARISCAITVGEIHDGSCPAAR